MMSKFIEAIVTQQLEEEALWAGNYKIPWNDPEFSQRMLAEHLSQDHPLASRQQGAIARQVEWIHQRIRSEKAGRLLDLGCGPGFYLERFADLGYSLSGIDFSPASIAHAKGLLGARAEVIEGDLRECDFGRPYDLICMLYGEFNVFSPEEAGRILGKCYEALEAGGSVLLEVQGFEAVRRIGEGPASWYRSGEGLAGLFSATPHVCLTEACWRAKEEVALQAFHILEGDEDASKSYRNTTQAWRPDRLEALAKAAGFEAVARMAEWPGEVEGIELWVLRK